MMTYAIWVIPGIGWDASDEICVCQTDASLLRVRRYCDVMGYELSAYTTSEIQTFGHVMARSKRDMTSDVRDIQQSRLAWRKERERRESLTPEEREAEHKTYFDSLSELGKLLYKLQQQIFGTVTNIQFEPTRVESARLSDVVGGKKKVEYRTIQGLSR